ncbi:tetratricopeptide repeat protein [Nocardioides panacis]|uniref:tetratricopeptide repeat protein n=1 Tax=Nocardioides panacis TaxID=2849501 RepID=UPI0020B3CAD4|nr:tetratricopeptide repeat protein [Nocardioides panacis]
MATPPSSDRGTSGDNRGGDRGDKRGTQRGSQRGESSSSGGKRAGAGSARGTAGKGAGKNTGSSRGAGSSARGRTEDPPFSRSRTEGRTDRPTRTAKDADPRSGARPERGGQPRSDGRGNRTSAPAPRTRGENGERSEEQARYDGPDLDPEITGKELDHNIAQQLRGLPEKLANRVARHLVAAGMLLEDDPETAYAHTQAARARAARIAVVREACGEAAYAAGHYTEALTELKAAKRLNGAQDYLPVMADCERALGRPDRALTLARNPAVANLEPHLKAEMTIVEAGARRDQGQLDAALRTLENAPLRNKTHANWVVRLRYAYADTLHAAGRTPEALEWFHRTIAIDNDHTTNAEQRIHELENQNN